MNNTKTKKQLEKLAQLTKGKQSKFVEETKAHEEQPWHKVMAEIAFVCLRQLRMQKKMQKQLAKELNVSPQLVNRWLKGKENLTIDTIVRLGNALGINLIKVQTQYAEPPKKPEFSKLLITGKRKCKVIPLNASISVQDVETLVEPLCKVL